MHWCVGKAIRQLCVCMQLTYIHLINIKLVLFVLQFFLYVYEPMSIPMPILYVRMCISICIPYVQTCVFVFMGLHVLYILHTLV